MTLGVNNQELWPSSIRQPPEGPKEWTEQAVSIQDHGIWSRSYSVACSWEPGAVGTARRVARGAREGGN